MGSTEGFFSRVPRRYKFLILFFSAVLPLFGQSVTSGSSGIVSLNSEMSRLETFVYGPGSGSSSPSPDLYNAFLNLVRLHRLSGNPEAAIKACEGALAVFPGDGKVLLEQGRLLVSLGEYEKAAAVITILLNGKSENELLIQGQYLAAQIEAFTSGNTLPLAALADDPKFAAYGSEILYTLWKLTDLSAWKNRLSAEFPQSMEARIISGTVNSKPMPLWLLFPGRNSIIFSVPALEKAPLQAAPLPAAPQAVPPQNVLQNVPPPSSVSATAQPQGQTKVLQAGLFSLSREDYAKALAEKLVKAGFESKISGRRVNENNYWVVYVPFGNDMNATIKKLKTAGFESFPIEL